MGASIILLAILDATGNQINEIVLPKKLVFNKHNNPALSSLSTAYQRWTQHNVIQRWKHKQMKQSEQPFSDGLWNLRVSETKL